MSRLDGGWEEEPKGGGVGVGVGRATEEVEEEWRFESEG